MSTKVIYTNTLFSIDKLQEDDYDYYILTENSWNDYGYETSFDVTIIREKEIYEGFSIKILAENQDSIIIKTRELFNQYLQAIENHSFELNSFAKNYKFISINLNYQELLELFSHDDFIDILKQLNDVLHLKEYSDPNNLLSLIDRGKEVFHNSLLRDQICKKIYYEGLRSLLTVEELDTSNYYFDFNYQLDKREYNLNFDFTENKLPNRINILVGKNGVGKTKVLENLVNYLKNPKEAKEYRIKVDHHPVFLSNLFVFSYNPYDDFYINKYGDDISIKYKYLGFRRYKNLKDIIKTKGIDQNILTVIEVLFKNEYEKKLLFINSLPAHIKKSKYDEEINNVSTNFELDKKNVTNAFDIALEYVNEIFIDLQNHDKIAFNSILELNEETIIKAKYTSSYNMINNIIIYINESIPNIEYLAIKNNEGDLIIYDEIYSWENIKSNECENKIFFLDETEQEIQLSSGQRIFTNFIINFCSMIKKNSLIIIDEPENTLHPNFELGFMKILEKVLKDYNSFAIIATHSSIITREVPKPYVNIILNKGDEIEVQKPLMNTYGANITDITNYIFDDIFESDTSSHIWLQEIIKEFKDNGKNFNDFKEEYNTLLGYDLLSEANIIFEE